MNTDTNVAVKQVGRPKAEIKYPRGIFTVDSLYELNRGPRGRGKRAKICRLTIRKHIAAQVNAGFLTKVNSVKSGAPGQPAAQFIRSAVKDGLEAARAARVEVPVAVEVAPVAEPAVQVAPEAVAEVVYANPTNFVSAPIVA